jgi:maltose/moltooligosaccharide transporter
LSRGSPAEPANLRRVPPATKSGLQIFNMNFGFLGIQFGWALQMANMSAIYEVLGAKPDDIPMLWLAAPLTGLIVQPLVGHWSDRTWGPLGRRRPYFLVGAILSTIGLILMPNVTSLWAAAGLLWILDASINISMEPFRAFIGDQLPPEQRTRGFAMQSLLIGLGAVVASSLPFLLSKLQVAGAAANGIPNTVRYSFWLGAAAFLGAVLWTIVSTPEDPPDKHSDSAGPEGGFWEAFRNMPNMMLRLAPIQVCTWLGLFCMWLYFPPVVARHVFGAIETTDPRYAAGIEWAGICFASYSLVTFLFSFALPRLAWRFGPGPTHAICLVAGAVGLGSVALIKDPNLLFLSMAGVGIAWASILSMPYAILTRHLPPGRTGVYMGIFNFFIVLPEIGVALGFGLIMQHVFHNERLYALILGAILLLLAAALSLRLERKGDRELEGRP